MANASIHFISCHFSILFIFWELNFFFPRKNPSPKATHAKLYDTFGNWCTFDVIQVNWWKRVLAMSRFSSSCTRNDNSLKPKIPPLAFMAAIFYVITSSSLKMKMVFIHKGMSFQRRELPGWRDLVCGHAWRLLVRVCVCVCACVRATPGSQIQLSEPTLPSGPVVQSGSSVVQGNIQSLYFLFFFTMCGWILGSVFDKIT